MIKANAYAKLNLNVHLFPQKLPNGFFPVKYLLCQTELHDEIILENRERIIEIFCDHTGVPKDETNLAYKSAQLIKEMFSKPELGVAITIQKNIPVCAGLGGGSSDAAAVIYGLQKLWQIKLNNNQLNYLAKNLGQEVYYCLQGELCEISGDGSVVNKLDYVLPKIYLIIITPERIKPSTGWIFEHLMLEKIGRNTDKYDKIIAALKKRDKKNFIDNIFNDFEESAEFYFPEIKEIKKDLQKNGARKAVMTGAGLSMVGYFAEENIAQEAYLYLKDKYKHIIKTETK